MIHRLKCKTKKLKHLEEKQEKILGELGFGNAFLDTTAKHISDKVMLANYKVREQYTKGYPYV